MKIEKLRKNHKKEIIIGTILTIVIGGALTFRLTHSKYRVTQSIDLGSGVINYKVPDFKIMAIKVSDDGANYSDSNAMPTENYVINEEKTYCGTSSGSQVKGKIKTENGKHYISGLNKGDKCYLYFDKLLTSEEMVTRLNITNIENNKPSFSNGATTNEGVFKEVDGMYGGTTYYWRGAVTNNYLKFAGFCWRIIRINGDGSLRLIYDGAICHTNGSSTGESIALTGEYNSNYNQSNYVGWTYSGTSQRTLSGDPSNAKMQLENWYNNKIENHETYTTKVAIGKFCNDRNADSWSINGSIYYAASNRFNNSNPTFSCQDDVYSLKIGLITVDEVIYAGAPRYSNTNQSYYLYNGNSYWTMSPYYFLPSCASVSFVNSYGGLDSNGVNNVFGLRPVINLRSNVTFSSGDGTISSPYTVG